MNILRFLISVTLVLTFISCASEYQIEGSSSVSLLDGKMLFVKVPVEGQLIDVDSAEVIHGLFEMQGEVDSARIASLYMDDQSIMPLVLENGKIQIVIDNVRSYVKGTPLNDKLYEFVTKKNSLDDKAYELERRESRMIMDGLSSDEIEAEMTKARENLSNEMDELAKGFISDNYENVLGPGVFMMLCNSFPYPILTPVIEAIVDQSPESFKNHYFVKEYMRIARNNMDKINAATD